MRAPVVPLVLCFVAGIVIQACLPHPAWLDLMGLCIAIGLGLHQLRQSSQHKQLLVSCVLVAMFCGGSFRQVCVHTTIPDPHVQELLEQQRVAGIWTVRIVTDPVYQPVPPESEMIPRPREDRTQCQVELMGVQQPGGEFIPLSGKVQLACPGDFTQMLPGQIWSVAGHLMNPHTAGNPLDFNYREFLSKQGLIAQLSAEHQAGLTMISAPAHTWSLSRLRHNVRKYIRQSYIDTLGSERAGLAQALILGDRRELDQEMKFNFFQTGLTHILAISGFHMGVLWFFTRTIMSLMTRNPTTVNLVSLTVMWLFTWLVNPAAPVVRATILATLMVTSKIIKRMPQGMSLLGTTFFLMLMYDPRLVFDLGTQLSFLAVWILIESHYFWQNYYQIHNSLWPTSMDPFAQLSQKMSTRERLEQVHTQTRYQQLLAWHRTFWQDSRTNILTSITIWLFMSPLTIHTFHLLTPYAWLLTWLSFPIAGFLLVCLFLLPVFAYVPILSSILASLSSGSMYVMTSMVSLGVDWPGSNLRVPTLEGWWMPLFYLVLLALWFRSRFFRHNSLGQKIPLLTILMLVTISGPVLAMFQDYQGHQRLTINILDVGHGGAVAVQCPNRRCLLYDVGSITGPRQVVSAVNAFMLSTGSTTIDELVVSHSDLDHFNGLSELIRNYHVREVLVSPSFADLRRRGVETTFNALTKYDVPFRSLQKGDEIQLDSQVKMEVLHPQSAQETWGAKDNENSVVLKITYAGRSILLTGDLEGEPAHKLTFEQLAPVDVLMAPHHGSMNANNIPFAHWTNPHVVVASHSDPLVPTRLAKIYQPGADVITCTNSGAVRVIIDPRGHMIVEQFSLPPAGQLNSQQRQWIPLWEDDMAAN
jgi:competence protein ComEC